MVAKGNEKHNAIAKLAIGFGLLKPQKNQQETRKPLRCVWLVVKLFFSSISFQIKKLENNEAIARRTKVSLKPRVSKGYSKGSGA